MLRNFISCNPYIEDNWIVIVIELQGLLTPKVSDIFIILYLIYIYVLFTHSCDDSFYIYMHHQYEYEMYIPTRQAVNKQSDSTKWFNEVIQRLHLVIYLLIRFNIVEDGIQSYRNIYNCHK